MNKVLAVIGAGELGMQIANYALNDNHYDDVVFFDDFINDNIINGYTILGKSDEIAALYDKKIFDELFIGIGYNHMRCRAEMFRRYSGKIPFGKIIHSSSYMDKTASVNEGCIVYPRCVIDKNVRIKENVLINLCSTISHDSVINSNTMIAPSATISGFVNIGDSCILGTNCTLVDNISIAAYSQIGAGSVVIKTIQDKGVYAGNPARFIR